MAVEGADQVVAARARQQPAARGQLVTFWSGREATLLADLIKQLPDGGFSPVATEIQRAGLQSTAGSSG
jgi:hypothetical protein